MSRGRRTELSELRIIAGRWRGRRVRFLGDGIRPTGDRIRETLFNWLAPRLPGARCLDLFAGSGALGIEALSRGAAAVTFVERDKAKAVQIRSQLDELGAGQGKDDATVLCTDALQGDWGSHGPYDVVFLDPPFDAGAPGIELGNLCTLLDNSGSLAADAEVYLEMARSQPLPELPPGWQIRRDKTAGNVRYALAVTDRGD